jgi:hypothetical protein
MQLTVTRAKFCPVIRIASVTGGTQCTHTPSVAVPYITAPGVLAERKLTTIITAENIKHTRALLSRDQKLKLR